MAKRRSIGALIGTVLLAVAAAFAPVGSARADGCNIVDVWNAAVNTIAAIGSSACATADENAELWIVVAGIAAAVAEADSNPGNPGTQFCQGVQSVLNSAQDAQTVENKVKGYANQYLSSDSANAVSQALDQLINATNSALDVVNVVQCACNIEPALSQDVANLGDCIRDALCALGALFDQPCTCTPSPPVQADCTPSPICNYGDDATAACQNAIYGNDQNPSWTKVQTIPGSSGTLIIQPGSGSDGAGHCAADHICFCPAPMVLVKIWDAQFGPGAYLYRCECPQGTQAAGDSGPDAFKCMCANGSQMQPDGSCVPPCQCKNNQIAQNPGPGQGFCTCTCPPGQVIAGDYCVTPCADPTKVLTSTGACCDPNQLTSCGECCPAGETPDPTTQKCRRTIVPVPVPIHQLRKPQ